MFPRQLQKSLKGKCDPQKIWKFLVTGCVVHPNSHAYLHECAHGDLCISFSPCWKYDVGVIIFLLSVDCGVVISKLSLSFPFSPFCVLGRSCTFLAFDCTAHDAAMLADETS